MNCTCNLTSAADVFPATYDQSSCATHGPDAPRYFVDHETIHDRVTGKHVELDDAAAMLSAATEAGQTIAWGVVVETGKMLKRLEAERASLSASLARATGALRDADSLLNSFADKIDWTPIPGPWARDAARIRNHIGNVLAALEKPEVEA